MKKIACVIYFFGKRYEKIGACAINSFKRFHPDIDLFHVNEHNGDDYVATKSLHEVGHGAYKYLLAAEIMLKHKYDKVIVLGADTITCSRLEEFIDGEEDILATLDYPYMLQIPVGNPITPNSETHVNADVICFNRVEPILDIVKIAKHFEGYAEQGALNYVLWSGKYEYSHRIVDAPYKDSNVIYNVRSKGNICLPYEYQDHSKTTGVPPKFQCYEKPWGEYTSKFYIKDNKLFTFNDKQIKVWHYCEGFGNMPEQMFIKLMNNYICSWFNKDTKAFFKQECDSGDFFEQEFSL
jgi:hypothetical protein|tara:strand:- start:1471 stop:2355 length:885 start_codon:yes stop_codon:yes gene_type:complete